MAEVYYIPAGPSNLSTFFPALDFGQIEEYWLEITVGGGILATTPVFKIAGCEDVRVHFLNYLGAIDSIGFEVTIEHESKSSSYQRPLKSPLVKAIPGTTRLNVKSNDNYTGTAIVQEGQMKWIDELLDSPLAWIQLAATQGQPADYIPILITDKKTTKQKSEERFHYEVVIEFSLSHERIVISN